MSKIHKEIYGDIAIIILGIGCALIIFLATISIQGDLSGRKHIIEAYKPAQLDSLSIQDSTKTLKWNKP